jgi:activator of HSP90 ATPase
MKIYKKYYIVPATPEEVYVALTRPEMLTLWTGEDAIMGTEPDSEFSLWEGSIVGKNLEFEPNKKIVQRWYFDEREDNSVVTIKLHKDPKGTSLELVHNNIPEEDYENITDGWDNVYMDMLIAFFEDMK